MITGLSSRRGPNRSHRNRTGQVSEEGEPFVLYIRSAGVCLLKARRDDLRSSMNEAVRRLPAIQSNDFARSSETISRHGCKFQACIFKHDNIYLAHIRQGTKKSRKYLYSFDKFSK